MLINKMLTFQIIPRRIAPYSEAVRQQLHTSIKLLSVSSSDSNSDSSSPNSDSSDSSSDSDSELKRSEPKKPEQPTRTENLNQLSNAIHKLNQIKASRIDVAIPKKPPQVVEKKKPVVTEESKFEEKFLDAAKDVAEKIGGDVKKTEMELLERLLNMNKSGTEESQPLNQSDILKEIKTMKRVAPIVNFQEKKAEHAREISRKINNFQVGVKGERATEVQEPQRSIIREMAEEHNRMKSWKETAPVEKNNFPDKRREKISTLYNLLKQERGSHGSLKTRESISTSKTNNLGVFDKEFTSHSEVVELTTWKELEERQLKFLQLHPPQNYFQEMIQWTEQGKIWHFPIDNEQGMKGEENVHFSEHVFMERHLKDWCPKLGPIRHFMELVCVGLSKNAFMTVDEKIGHIMWYKDYFGDKRDLLSEIVAFQSDAPNILPKPTKKIDLGPHE